MTKISIFPELLNTKKNVQVNLSEVLHGIKTGGRSRKLIEQIRLTPDKEERDELKKQLPVALFGGTFSERRASALQTYSRCICLDFDEIECLEDKKQELISNPYIYAVWLSPTGTGLKALVKVSSDSHLSHALALLREFPDADPNAIKDINRSTFMSLDPDIAIKENSEIFTKIVESVHTDQQKYDKLKKWLDSKGEQFISGNRNNFIAKLSGAMNRFGISEQFANEVIERDFCKDSTFSLREAQSVIKSMYTNYMEQFGTASFDDAMSETEVSIILSSEVTAKDVITVNDVREDLNEAFISGIKGGDTTHYPELDKCFRFMRGELTTLTGVAGAGKSSILAQLLIIRAALNGQKAAFLSMESYPPVFFYREFARTLIGKSVEHDNPYRMSKKEYDLALEFINEMFFFIYPSKDEPSPDWVLGRFGECVVKYGIDTCVIDPVNSMSYDYKSASARDDRMIAGNLSKYQRFSLQNNQHFFLCAHPRGIGKKEDGTYKEPSADEISGGPTYWQRSDNILCFHRPSLPLDFKDPTCTLRSLKIKKSQLNGIPGVSTFTYNRTNGRYYENGFNPLDKFLL